MPSWVKVEVDLMSQSYKESKKRIFSTILIIILLSSFLLPSNIELVKANADAETLNQTGTLWAPYLEWSLNNPSWSGNPFDVVATVTFLHQGSGETRLTEMFYAGGTTWKFRFTGTRTGLWTFTTSSSDSDLNSHSGNITITPNPNHDIKGFLVRSGNKFAQQVGENGELIGVIYNVWQGGNFPNGVHNWYNNPNLINDLNNGINNYVIPHGATALYSTVVANRWFNLETQQWDQHDKREPDLRTFEALENAITHLHTQGIHLHIWAWGDEDRRQTPIGAGGINGTADRRVQRYIAARLGPLPGWAMNYGYDLGEWVSESQLDSWASYMNERMGWPHLLFSRGYATQNMTGRSYSSNGPGSPVGAIQTSPNGPASFSEVVSHIDSDANRPHLFEERFIYLREMAGGPPWTMDRTRRVMWWNAMAGGVGAFWGVWDGPIYPNPEQMRTHARFWDNRFHLDMTRANHLTDGAALKTPSNDLFIFYKENTNSIIMNLSGMSGYRQAVAIDTKLAYSEIAIGSLGPSDQTWTAPFTSDWAVAVGPVVEPSAPPPQGPALRINFQTAGTITPPGFLPDNGLSFGDRNNGQSYGWNSNNSSNARERRSSYSPSKQSDTLNHLLRNGNYSWELAVPNGEYHVRIAAGDPDFTDGIYHLRVEGVTVINSSPSPGNQWVSGHAFVTVSDGKLTISNGDQAQNNKINFIEVTPADLVKNSFFLPLINK
jgi:hypothetical protein